MTVGFLGTMANTNLITTILTIWVVKVLYEIVALPISMPISNWVKRVEGVDVIDRPETTNYSPFSLDLD